MESDQNNCKYGGRNTRQNQQNEINMFAIYKVLPDLERDNLSVIFCNFKLPELYQLLNDPESFEKYIDEANRNIKIYTQMVQALTELRVRAAKESEKPYDNIENICRVYDGLSDERKKDVCVDLLNRREFFVDVYMNDALRAQKDHVEDTCKN